MRRALFMCCTWLANWLFVVAGRVVPRGTVTQVQPSPTEQPYAGHCDQINPIVLAAIAAGPVDQAELNSCKALFPHIAKLTAPMVIGMIQRGDSAENVQATLLANIFYLGIGVGRAVGPDSQKVIG